MNPVLKLCTFLVLHSIANSSAEENYSIPTTAFARESNVLSMFEMMMSTLETKLRRVENLDRAVQVLMRKMDGIEQLLKVRVKSNELQHLTNKMDKLEALLNAEISSRRDEEEEERNDNPAQPSKIVQERIALNEVMTTTVTSAVESMKSVVNGMDRRLGFHINLVSENLGKMTNMIQEVHGAVLDENKPLNYTISNFSKLDRLINQIHPLIEVKDKMDEVRGMMVGTKSSVDGLVPKSEELLTQTHRQERAISNIHMDLNEKTNKIINELTQVEDELLKTKQNIAIIKRKGNKAKVLNIITRTDLPVTTNTNASEDLPSSSPKVSTEEIHTTKGPAVIFPSVQNKPPLVSNSSFTYHKGVNTAGIKGHSCADIYRQRLTRSGTYYLQIRGINFLHLKVFCDMETAGGGWTVIQRRDDFGIPRENFNRDWNDYKFGFGKLTQEFWLGNENIHTFTSNDEYEMRIDLQDFEGNTRYASYKHFKLSSEEDEYRLELDGYEGDAGDSLNDPWYGSQMKPFSTYDNDNDQSSLNCASMLKGGWWWKSCGRGLNGLYLTDPQDLTARQGIVWFRWRGWDYSLKHSKMMIRPKNFKSYRHTN